MSPDVHVTEGVKQYILHVLYDPQTSGGLLISVPQQRASELIEELRNCKALCYDIIGRAVEKKEKYVIVK